MVKEKFYKQDNIQNVNSSPQYYLSRHAGLPFLFLNITGEINV